LAALLFLNELIEKMNRVTEKKEDDQNEKTPPLFRNDSERELT